MIDWFKLFYLAWKWHNWRKFLSQTFDRIKRTPNFLLWIFLFISEADISSIHPSPNAPPLPPRPLPGFKSRKRASEVTDVFHGPVFFPSMTNITTTTTTTQHNKHDDNNNRHNNRVRADNRINNKKAFIKLKLSRAPSRSLDSIHGTMLDANVSRLFSEMTIDELFPKVVEHTHLKNHENLSWERLFLFHI